MRHEDRLPGYDGEATAGQVSGLWGQAKPKLNYLILDMQIRAMTCRNVVRGKTPFWLHDLGRSGERAVRRRSLVIKELSRSILPLVFLATFFGRFCKFFAGHQPFAADTPT